MKTKQAPAPRRPGNQVGEEKVKAANAYLKNADLSLVYEALEKIKKQRHSNVPLLNNFRNHSFSGTNPVAVISTSPPSSTLPPRVPIAGLCL